MKKIKLFSILILLFAVLLFSCNSKKGEQEITSKGNELSVPEENTPEEESDGITFFSALIIIVVVIILVAANFFFFRYIFPVGLWFKAWTAGVKIGIRAFLNMYFQKIPPDLIVNNLITAKKSGVELKTRQLEDYYLAKIDINELVKIQIEAHNAHVELDIDKFAKAYMAHVNLKELLKALVLVHSAGISASFDDLVKFHHSGVNIVKVIEAKIEVKNSGFSVEFPELVSHYLAGGDLDKTVDAFIAAKKANIKDFSFSDVADLDMAGYQVFEVVEKAIIPKVIQGDKVRGVARDGVELTMKVKATLRAKLKYILGNPDESTILARINESLATEIGLSESHYHVLENPFELAEKVEKKSLDKGTAFEILSIDVSDITIGKDVHAELKTERAHAEAAKAKADLIRAEEKLKRAIAAAFIDGNISVSDYEKLMNTQADTRMRNSISKYDLTADDEKEHHHEEHDENEHDKHH